MSFFKKDELKLLWPFYIDALISPMLFFMPAFAIIYFLGLNFTFFQIGVLTMAAPAVMLLFEIPTGAFADLYGRKTSVLFGIILQAISFSLLFFFQNFYLIILILAMIGISSSFVSGADEAWVTDLIKSKNKNLLHRFFAKKQAFDAFGIIVSGILGAFAVKSFGISVIWIACTISFLLSFCFLSFAKYEHLSSKKQTKIYEGLNKQVIKSFAAVRKNLLLFSFLIAGMIAAFSGVFGGNLSWTPFLQNLGFKDYFFGYLWSGIGLMSMAGAVAFSKFYKKRKERELILITLIALVILVLSVFFIKSIFLALVIFFVTMFLVQLSRPAERIYFHSFVPKKLRATIGSIESMSLSVAGLIAMPLAGLAVDYMGARWTIFISGLLSYSSSDNFF